jgi:hypothetical protein
MTSISQDESRLQRGRFRPVRWPVAATGRAQPVDLSTTHLASELPLTPGDGHESGRARAPQGGTAKANRSRRQTVWLADAVFAATTLRQKGGGALAMR